MSDACVTRGNIVLRKIGNRISKYLTLTSLEVSWFPLQNLHCGAETSAKRERERTSEAWVIPLGSVRVFQQFASQGLSSHDAKEAALLETM